MLSSPGCRSTTFRSNRSRRSLGSFAAFCERAASSHFSSTSRFARREHWLAAGANGYAYAGLDRPCMKCWGHTKSAATGFGQTSRPHGCIMFGYRHWQGQKQPRRAPHDDQQAFPTRPSRSEGSSAGTAQGKCSGKTFRLGRSCRHLPSYLYCN